jgi:LPXTG-motif cell wall-anchored protein
MKKALTILLPLAFVVALAAPALAQVRDPFNPAEQSQSDEQGGDQQVDTEGNQPFEQQGQGQESDNEPEPVRSNTDALPTTGGDFEFWLVVSFGLLAIGGGFVLLHKLGAPVPIRRRTRR